MSPGTSDDIGSDSVCLPVPVMTARPVLSAAGVAAASGAELRGGRAGQAGRPAAATGRHHLTTGVTHARHCASVLTARTARCQIWPHTAQTARCQLWPHTALLESTRLERTAAPLSDCSLVRCDNWSIQWRPAIRIG